MLICGWMLGGGGVDGTYYLANVEEERDHGLCSESLGQQNNDESNRDVHDIAKKTLNQQTTR